MIFLSGHIQGFGRFRDFRFDFGRGLNLVFAPNEGGKSTLQHYLLGLLYGQLRSDLKLQRRLDPWVDRYKPWSGQEYGGMLFCRLEDGMEMEIRRAFGKDETRIEILTSTGEDITKQYDQQRNGEVLFAKHHFGMPKELYESLGIIRETRVSEIQSHDTIRDRLTNLAHSGDEEVSTRRILKKLNGLLDVIGSERAPTKPYRQARDLVQRLQSERREVEEQRSRYREWVRDRNRIADEIRELDGELFKIRGSLVSAKRQDVAARIASLEDLERDREGLRVTIDSLAVQEDFPLESLEELNQLVGASESIVERLDEVRTEKETSSALLKDAESKRRGFEPYAELAESPESEEITEWFVSYMSLSLQKESLKKRIDSLQNEVAVLTKRVEALSPDLRNPEIDWAGFAREAAEDERMASVKGSDLAKEAATEKAKQGESVRSAFNRRLGAVLLAAMAAAPFAVRHLMHLEGISEWFEYGFGSLCLVLAVFLWISASKIYGGGRLAEQKALDLDRLQSEVKEQASVKRKELDRAIANSGFRGLETFLKAARQSEQDRNKLADLTVQLEEALIQSRRQDTQSEETFQLLKESLAGVGLSCSPGNLKSQVDLLRNNMKQFRDLDAEYHRCIQKVEALRKEEKSLEEESGFKNERIASLMEQAGVDTIERFREECAKRQKAKELIEKEASRTREFDRLLEGKTILQWKESLLELETEEKAHAEESAPDRQDRNRNAEPGAQLLPYIPSIAELQEKERAVMARTSDAKQEHAHLVERVNHAFQNYRPSSEIDEDLAIAEQKLEEHERNREALGTAIETIEILSRHQQEVLAPQLNAAVEQRFIRLCDGRYKEVKIDPDFNVRVRETGTEELRLADLLSRGTQDQLYFAIRFGILDLVSNGTETCPCLLDEPFAAYDRPRLLQAYEILAEESARRQLILFTCREDLYEIARERKDDIIRLT